MINNDADEFWWPRSGTLASTFEGLGDEVGIVVAHRTNFVPRPEDGRPFWERMTARERESLNPLGKPLPPKVAHRAHPEITVVQGNHRVEGPDLGGARRRRLDRDPPLPDAHLRPVREQDRQGRSRVRAQSASSRTAPAAPGDACMSSGSRASFAITTTGRSSPGRAATTWSRTPGCGTTCARFGPAPPPARRAAVTGPRRRPGRRSGAALARHARPQREVDLRAQLGEPRGVLPVALGELLARRSGASSGVPRPACRCFSRRSGGFVGRLDAEEPPGALHLADRVLDAALELQDQHLLAGEELEHVAELLEVEAAPGRVADRGQPDAIPALLGHPLQPGDRRAVAGDGIAEHDQEPSVRGAPCAAGRSTRSPAGSAASTRRRAVPAGRGNSEAYSAAMSSGASPRQKRSK